MFIELHMIQNFVPSNLNRDDTGSPKDCEFGGVRRARISSQCLKRAIREAPVFERTVATPKGVRTKRLVEQMLKMWPVNRAQPAEAEPVLAELVSELLSKLEKSGKTQVLVFISPEELQQMVDGVLAQWEALMAVTDKERSRAIKEMAKELERAFRGRTSAPDIALFGRMLASNPSLNLDAACQVAHAISTHRVSMEMDFYTAVDELNPDDTAGAGMMGFIGYDSACFYRYARLDWEQLLKNLDGDVALARRTVEGFLRAAVAAVPTGKQNSFAAHNPPSFLLAVVREDGMGWNLANAFERPVYPRAGTGYVAPSVEALGQYWDRLVTVYGGDTIRQVAALDLDPDLPLNGLGQHRTPNLEAWIGRVLAGLPAAEEAS
ncbi:type I-E CRISPR-associated protein Cas7/Cse4/CasC [Litorilinea aerophila]|uniref:Type I-E CRISPR-associated protein Cas7/Cse4/CasC n=1 Tax=Litorilinea aerophila TaxID=1204385 RepID=A0A540VBW7_9CHLR|nr:type I-E CRISPR-associated protein Cas7/Cse4/CasC [Litorilinea aerophila]MCC9077952.1 type I-E CRISPR-associated protein Cas7/Cse4/CasC [Litorilinea aerophila]